MRKWGKWGDREIGKFNCSSRQMAAGKSLPEPDFSDLDCPNQLVLCIKTPKPQNPKTPKTLKPHPPTLKTLPLGRQTRLRSGLMA